MFLRETKYVDKSKSENFKLNEKYLWRLSEIICQDWKSIGRYLGLKEFLLAQIESKYANQDGIRECCYQMLLVWFENFNHQAYLEQFCTKLIQMNFNLYAKESIECFFFV